MMTAVFAVLVQGYDSTRNQRLTLSLEPENILALTFRLILVPRHSDASQEAEDLKCTIDNNPFDVEDKETRKSWLDAFDFAVNSYELLLYGTRTFYTSTFLFVRKPSF